MKLFISAFSFVALTSPVFAPAPYAAEMPAIPTANLLKPGQEYLVKIKATDKDGKEVCGDNQIYLKVMRFSEAGDVIEVMVHGEKDTRVVMTNAVCGVQGWKKDK